MSLKIVQVCISPLPHSGVYSIVIGAEIEGMPFAKKFAVYADDAVQAQARLPKLFEKMMAEFETETTLDRRLEPFAEFINRILD